MRAALVVLMLLLSAEAWAAPSLLALCHKDFNCAGVKRLYREQETLVVSYLENTFGTTCKCLNTLLDDPRPKIIRAHLIQSPCMRNKRCGRYEALWGYTVASANRAARNPKSRLRKRFNVILEQFKQRLEGRNVTCYVSPCLECDLHETARKTLANLVSAAVPSCNLVDNPYRRKCLPGMVCEKHGLNPILSRPCIVDLDGYDGSLVNARKWMAKYSHCDLRYYWEPWMNCIRGEFVDPRKRDCKYDNSIFEGALCRSFWPQSSDICLP